MPILYCIVASGTDILAEYSTASGNFTNVTKRILAKIPKQDGKQSYEYDRHVFHYVVSEGVTFLCMTEDGFKNSVAFAFLDEIKTEWSTSYSKKDVKRATAYGMNESFAPVLQRKMEYYSSDPDSDKVGRVKRDVDEVKGLMVNNIDKVLDRQEKIEILVDKTDGLSQNAFKFKKRSKELKNVMWWKNVKIILIIGTIVIFVIFMIFLIACDGFSCTKSNDDEHMKKMTM